MDNFSLRLRNVEEVIAAAAQKAGREPAGIDLVDVS